MKQTDNINTNNQNKNITKQQQNNTTARKLKQLAFEKGISGCFKEGSKKFTKQRGSKKERHSKQKNNVFLKRGWWRKGEIKDGIFKGETEEKTKKTKTNKKNRRILKKGLFGKHKKTFKLQEKRLFCLLQKTKRNPPKQKPKPNKKTKKGRFKTPSLHPETQPTILLNFLCNLHAMLCKSCALLKTL